MNAIDLTSALRRRKRRRRPLPRAVPRRRRAAAHPRGHRHPRARPVAALYESAARSAEVLRLDVEDLDLANRRAKVTRKGGAVDVIVWQTGTARLLPRLLKGRKSGPLFLTDRRSRVELPPGDIDPASGKARLSYRQAAEIFEEATAGEQGGPWTLHQLRHSALTHDAENGAHADADGQERSHVGRVASPVRAAVRRGAAALAGAQRPGAAKVGPEVLGPRRVCERSRSFAQHRSMIRDD